MRIGVKVGPFYASTSTRRRRSSSGGGGCGALAGFLGVALIISAIVRLWFIFLPAIAVFVLIVMLANTKRYGLDPEGRAKTEVVGDDSPEAIEAAYAAARARDAPRSRKASVFEVETRHVQADDGPYLGTAPQGSQTRDAEAPQPQATELVRTVSLGRTAALQHLDRSLHAYAAARAALDTQQRPSSVPTRETARQEGEPAERPKTPARAQPRRQPRGRQPHPLRPPMRGPLPILRVKPGTYLRGSDRTLCVSDHALAGHEDLYLGKHVLVRNDGGDLGEAEVLRREAQSGWWFLQFLADEGKP